MKRNESGPKKLARLNAKLARIGSRRMKAKRVGETAVTETHVSDRGPSKTHRNRNKPRSVWALFGKAALAVLGLAITAVSLTLAHADSHLEIVGSRSPELRGYSPSGTSFTFLCVVYCTFTNNGLRSDYVDHIDIHPVDLDKTIKSEPKFTDRRIVAWREKKELRFEILVTSDINIHELKDFLLTFYDSKGRQVGQMPVAAGFEGPKAMDLNQERMKSLSYWEFFRPPGAMVTGLTLSGSVPEALSNSHRRYFAKISAISGEVVAESNADGETERDGRIELQIKILSSIPPNGFVFDVWTDPPRDPWLAFQMTWTITWSDGTVEKFILTPPPPPTGLPATGVKR
jgi:hypothetical protein